MIQRISKPEKTKCPYCSGDCSDSGALIRKCPHCVLIVINHSGARKLPHELLKDIADSCGAQTLSDRRLMQNIWADIAPWGMEKTGKLLLLAVADGISGKLKNIKGTKKAFADRNSIPKEIADYLVDSFAYALGETKSVKHPERATVERWFCDRAEYEALQAKNNPQPKPQPKPKPQQPQPKPQPQSPPQQQQSQPQATKGRIDYHNGDYYIGEMVNGQPNGKGKMHLKNGGWQEGAFINGALAGQGKRYDPDISRKTAGKFDNDRLYGKIRYEWDNGDWFKGYAKTNAYKYAAGIYFYRNGGSEKGEFVDGNWVAKQFLYDRIGNWFWSNIWFVPYVLGVFYFLISLIQGSFFGGLFGGFVVFCIVAVIIYLLEKAKNFFKSLPRWIKKGIFIFLAISIGLNIITGVAVSVMNLFERSEKSNIETVSISGKWSGSLDEGNRKILLELEIVSASNNKISAKMTIHANTKVVYEYAARLEENVLYLENKTKSGNYSGDFEGVISNGNTSFAGKYKSRNAELNFELTKKR